MNKTKNDDDLLVEREVSDITRRPVGTLRYWRSTNQGPPYIKLGRGVVYRRSAIEDFIRAGERATQTDAAG